MIAAALRFLAAELGEHLVATQAASPGEVTIGRLVDDTGKTAIKNQSLALALFAADEDRELVANLPLRHEVRGAAPPLPPLCLTVIVAAHYAPYDVALHRLATVLEYFQARPVFTRDAYATLDARIERLSVALLPLSIADSAQLWATVGGKQLPSLVYRIRFAARSS